MKIIKKRGDPVVRFWKRVQKTDSCWNWISFVNAQGYGNFPWRGAVWGAHRVAYTLAKGEIPKELVIDHLCRNQICVNPDHLEAVTSRENILRGVGMGAKHARKTHCLRKHAFDKENTRVYKTRNGQTRRCRKCTYLKYHNKKLFDSTKLQPHQRGRE